MVGSEMKRSVTLAAAVLFIAVEGRPSFPDLVPNGRNVKVEGEAIQALGHNSRTSSTGQGFNKFGTDFLNNGQNWANICNLDSDGDGISNGEELCDPDCNWNSGDADPDCDAAGLVLGHPGEEPGFQVGGLPDYVMAHLAVMIISWLFLAPAGILLVVSQKRTGAWWFVYHRGIMSAVTAGTVLGVVIMGANIGFDAFFNNQHTKVGTVVLVFALLQPLSGILRPHVPPKGEAKSTVRLLWEAQHQWLGRITMFLAIFAVITGVSITFDDSDAVGYLLGAMFGIVATCCFIFVFCVRDKEKYTGYMGGNSGLTFAAPAASAIALESKSGSPPTGAYDKGYKSESKTPMATAVVSKSPYSSSPALSPEATKKARSKDFNDFQV